MVFATGLGAGILLDATVVRGLLVPALVSLFGEWNWWLPNGVARVLRIRPSTSDGSDRGLLTGDDSSRDLVARRS